MTKGLEKSGSVGRGRGRGRDILAPRSSLLESRAKLIKDSLPRRSRLIAQSLIYRHFSTQGTKEDACKSLSIITDR